MSPKYFPPFQLGNQTRDTRENIFQGKLEPLRKKQVIEKYFTQDELDLVLGDSLEKDSLERIGQISIGYSTVIYLYTYQTSRCRIMDSFTTGTVYYCSF